MTIVLYDKQIRIENLASLPRGTGARYLECIRHHNNPSILIAKKWRRKLGTTAEVMVDFSPGLPRTA